MEERSIFGKKERCRPSVVTLSMVAVGALGVIGGYLLFALLGVGEYLGALDTVQGGWNVSEQDVCAVVVSFSY